uniref:IP05279p n=1 Tax=Drosophila melanogaster TaxID=7227 RepID=Q9VVE9_DROME|nr:uncharacterized protein Dmel_CG13723 [Drosophila melanogaster]AAF49362.1 uncharacterized protein Dmel_CG13723 [Drosophila melanogaster]ABF85722.1 IP05279p [Drosophila melanogaster]|eukprot:NP_648964.1 uncharacterized protein Dmel_CG13723 [Drosophila melanogaster]
MSLDYTNLLLNCLANFYHAIYFYVSLFSMSYCVVLWQVRHRIYQMDLSWERISLVYSCAAALILILTLVIYYSWMAMVLIWRQYCVYYSASKRTRFLFDLYRRQLVGELK